MSTEDKMKNNADLAKGKIKEGIGRATNDKGLEGEGKLDQGSAATKNKVEDAKDAAKGGFAS